MSDDPREVQLEGLLNLVIELVLERIHGNQIGVVLDYDATKQSCTVQPLLSRPHVTETGERVAKPQPALHDVPVWHFGQSSGRVTVPVKRGDYGLILHHSIPLGRFKRAASGSKIVDPGDDTRHDIFDAFFVPGGHSFSAVPTDAPIDAIVLHGPSKIGGSSGTEKTIKADTWQTAHDVLINGIGSILDGVVPGAADAVTTLLETFNDELWKTTEAEVK